MRRTPIRHLPRRPKRLLTAAGCLLGLLLLGLASIVARPVPSPDATLAKKLAYYHDRLSDVLGRGLAAELSQRRAARRGGVQDHILVRGAGDSKRVALTFDDGPHPDTTPQLIAILNRYKVHATFFVVGKMAKLHPELLRQELQAGNELGNHTYHHMNLERVSPERIRDELTWGGQIIRRCTGVAPRLFRPPGGNYDQVVLRTAAALGYTIVLWSDNPGDYAEEGAAAVRQRVMARLRPGSVVVLHDGLEQTVQALPLVLEDLQRSGYQCVTVSQLISGAGQTGRPPAAG